MSIPTLVGVLYDTFRRAAWILALATALGVLLAPAFAGAEAPTFPLARWSEDVSEAPLDAQSDAVIAWLESAGGWGLGRFQIDFSFEVATATATTSRFRFRPTSDHFSPDCDLEAVPIPLGAALEGESGLACTSDGDCHLIVVDPFRRRLYEMWHADIAGGIFRGGCLAVWNLDGQYPPQGRGADCTSADAAGLPIAPLLIDADEVAAGQVGHAARFVLPNDRIRALTYVAPASHSTPATSGPADAPPYGARFRLRADYPVEGLPTEGARVVARALQRHGMFLADGGSVALTVRSDRSTQASWEDVLGPHDLRLLQVSDFEMVEAGPRFAWTGSCSRLPMPSHPACADGVDNDGDGLTDFGSDAGCSLPWAFREDPACDNGRDDDGDGLVDLDDPHCHSAAGVTEVGPRRCGLGFEVTPMLAGIGLLGRRLRRSRRAS